MNFKHLSDASIGYLIKFANAHATKNMNYPKDNYLYT